MASEIKLRPCPFCGGEAVHLGTRPDGFGVCCMTCGDYILGYESREAAAESWNRRAGE